MPRLASKASPNVACVCGGCGGRDDGWFLKRHEIRSATRFILCISISFASRGTSFLQAKKIKNKNKNEGTLTLATSSVPLTASAAAVAGSGGDDAAAVAVAAAIAHS